MRGVAYLHRRLEVWKGGLGDGKIEDGHVKKEGDDSRSCAGHDGRRMGV